jgi:hypothetical protein
MRSIRARFCSEQQKNPFLSDVTNFALAVKSQKFTRKMIHENFNKFVSEEDYKHLESSEKKQLLQWLVKLSNQAEEG